MKLSPAAKQLAEGIESLSQIESAITSAEQRLNMAKRDAQGLEERNRISRENLDKEIETKRQVMTESLDEEFTRRQQDLLRLREQKSGLLTEVDDLKSEKAALNAGVEELDKRSHELIASIAFGENSISEQRQESIDLETERYSKVAEAERLDNKLSELSGVKLQVERTLETLKTHESDLEDKIMALDAEFKDKRDRYEQQLAEASTKLQDALSKYQETMNTDKRVRAAWAEEHMKLEKREKAVYLLESRVKGLQRRASELQNYLQL